LSNCSVNINSLRNWFISDYTDIYAYRFGFNGQEKDDEISGTGNSYTAEFWQYDPRLGRRWNVDPVIKYHESPYAALTNNPIIMLDPNGADSIVFHRGPAMDESDGVTLIFKITVSVIENGVEKTLPLQMLMVESAEAVRDIPSTDITNKTFTLVEKPMPSHPLYENELNLKGTGMWIHPGNQGWVFRGCKGISFDMNVYDEYRQDGARTKSIYNTQDALNKIHEYNELFESMFNLTGEKFILTGDNQIRKMEKAIMPKSIGSIESPIKIKEARSIPMIIDKDGK
jgi:RHS repeat-associated protein